MSSLPCGKCNIAGWLVGEQPVKTSAFIFNCVCSCLFSYRREKETTVWAEKETTFWALKCALHQIVWLHCPGKTNPRLSIFSGSLHQASRAQIHSRNGVGCGCVQHQIYWATQKWICYIPFLMPSSDTLYSGKSLPNKA